MDKQRVAARLAALYGVAVRTGLTSSPEAPEKAEYFERDDGVTISPEDIAAAHAWAEANPPLAPLPARNVFSEIDDLKARLAAVERRA